MIQIMRGQKMTITPFPEPKKLPDGSLPFLQIDQTPALKHNLNAHGWPANNVQEYVNNENVQLQKLMLERLSKSPVLADPNASLSDAQKAALCIPRSAQTYSEFVQCSLRADELRKSFDSAKKSASKSDEELEKDSDEDVNNDKGV